MNPSWNALNNPPGWFLDPVAAQGPSPGQQQLPKQGFAHYRPQDSADTATSSLSSHERAQQHHQQQQAHFDQQIQLSSMLNARQGNVPLNAAAGSQHAANARPSVHFQLEQQHADAQKGMVSGHFNSSWAMPTFSEDTATPRPSSTLPLSMADLQSGFPSARAMPDLSDSADPRAFLNLAQLPASQHANLGMGTDHSPVFYAQSLSGRGSAVESESARARAPRKASPFTASTYRVQHGVSALPQAPTGPNQHRSFSVPTRFGPFPGSSLQSVPEGSMQAPPPMRTAGTIGCPADYAMEGKPLALLTLGL